MVAPEVLLRFLGKREGSRQEAGRERQQYHRRMHTCRNGGEVASEELLSLTRNVQELRSVEDDVPVRVLFINT